MVRNVHTREVGRDPHWFAREMGRVAEPDSQLWPTDSWPPMVLDRRLAVGAAGGHSAIRYLVAEYEPGRRLTFRFDPEIGISGTHTFELLPAAEPGRTVLRHEVAADLSGSARLLWPIVIRWLHDALVEDLMDRAEFDADALPPVGSRWSPWVRILRRVRKTSGNRAEVRA